MPRDDDPGPDELKGFYDLERAAEAATRWPLLKSVWEALGGDARLAPGSRRIPTLAAAKPETVTETSRPGHQPATSNGNGPPAENAPKPPASAGQSKPAQSLEELFGRIR